MLEIEFLVRSCIEASGSKSNTSTPIPSDVPPSSTFLANIGIQNRDIPYIWKMAALLVAFGVMGLLCSLLAQYFAAKAAVGFGTELRHDLFCHIEQLSYAAVDKAGSATLVVRITSDINQVQYC